MDQSQNNQYDPSQQGAPVPPVPPAPPAPPVPPMQGAGDGSQPATQQGDQTQQPVQPPVAPAPQPVQPPVQPPVAPAPQPVQPPVQPPVAPAPQPVQPQMPPQQMPDAFQQQTQPVQPMTQQPPVAPPMGGMQPPMGGQAGGFPPAGQMGGAQPGAAQPGAQEPEDTTPANFQIGKDLPAQLSVPVPDHELNFDEDRFIRLLAGSISLSKAEKKRIIESIPKLKQTQVDELIRIFEDEKVKFAELSQKHVPELERLAKKHLEDWIDIETEFKAEGQKEEESAEADEIRKQLGL